MDKAALERLVKMMTAENDMDAVMGLRGLQGHLKAEGIGFQQAMEYLIAHLREVRHVGMSFDQVVDAPEPAKSAGTAITVSGMPQCWSPKAGAIEIIPSGEDHGEIVALQGAAAGESEVIAMNLKDALVAAAINKSKMKLKVKDNKNAQGEIIETILQAEYERDGMSPIRVWVNARGEVAALAALLRKAVANAWPELMAA